MKEKFNLKRVMSFLLAALLILGCVPSVFADDMPKVTLTADKDTVLKGEELTLELKIDKDWTDAYIWQWEIVFDSDYFEITSAKRGGVYSKAGVNKNSVYVYESPMDSVSVTSGSTTVLHTVKAGTLATVVLTAKQDITAAETAVYADKISSKTGIEYENEDGNFVTDPVDVAIVNATGKENPIKVNVLTEAPAEPAYTVTMPEDKTVNVGETVNVPVKVGYTTEDETNFNAFDMTFAYDAAALELTSTAIEGLTVTTGEGTVRVQGYGADKEFGEAFALTFKAIAAKESEIKVTTAKVDNAEGAISTNAPDAVLVDDAMIVKADGYTVALPDDFTGEATVNAGEDYTFEAKDKNFDYTVTATMGDKEAAVKDNGDGTFTIEDVDGNIVITATKEGKKYDVTLGADMTGELKAQYGKDYTATLTKDEDYTYEVAVKIGGENYTGFTVENDTYTIPGADIKGAIEFVVTKTEIPAEQFEVTFAGTGAGEAAGEATATEDEDYTFTVTKAVGYNYTVTATMGGENAEVKDNGDGTYTIKAVTGDLVITVEKESDLAVEVSEYVELDGKTMFLVTATGTLEEGKVFAYDTNAMYYSEEYEAYAYLVVVEGEALTAEAAKTNITAVEATAVTLADKTDVNMSGLVDINDAQLTYDMYNGAYEDFAVVSMQKFLNADVNNDKAIDVTDATAIVAAIQ
ncbi:MAG: hypothetical protein E7218_02365 [Anaerofustis stercorihominis]|nr:hypothetical protein [Anaerofustis stercorihominis]